MQTKSMAALLAAATLSGSALAQGYLGAGIGHARVNLDCTGTTTCDKTDTTFKFYGGYMFGPNIGIEGVYYDNGKLHQTGDDAELGRVSADWKGSAFAAFAVGVLPMDNFSAFAKLGVASARVKLDASSTMFGNAGDSERHTAVAFGAGVGYAFTPRLGGRLEFERLRLEFMGDKRNADLVTLGLHYRF
jgi:OOP family OmpA-OmpF porin